MSMSLELDEFDAILAYGRYKLAGQLGPKCLLCSQAKEDKKKENGLKKDMSELCLTYRSSLKKSKRKLRARAAGTCYRCTPSLRVVSLAAFLLCAHNLRILLLTGGALQ
jgi:hypothetical protein